MQELRVLLKNNFHKVMVVTDWRHNRNIASIGAIFRVVYLNFNIHRQNFSKPVLCFYWVLFGSSLTNHEIFPTLGK